MSFNSMKTSAALLLRNDKSISYNFIKPNGHELHSLAQPVVAIVLLRAPWARWVTQLPLVSLPQGGRESRAWSSTIRLHLDWQLPVTAGLTLLWQHSCSCHLSPSHMIAQPSQSNSSSRNHKLQPVFHLLCCYLAPNDSDISFWWRRRVFFRFSPKRKVSRDSACCTGSILLFYSEKYEPVSTFMFLSGKCFVTQAPFLPSHQD